MQIKALLGEKERLSEENKQRIDMAESDLDRVKNLEMKLAQIYLQKEQIMNLIERLRDGMPSDSLQRVFGEIIETIHECFRVEEEVNECENSLLMMEGELRGYAKKEVSGLLSTKVINLRRDVDKFRNLLREIHEQRELILKRRESLE